MDEKVNCKRTKDSSDNDEMIDPLAVFPLSEEDELKTIEIKLLNKTFKSQLVKEITWLKYEIYLLILPLIPFS